jgi:hypothetical protein
VPHVGVKRNAYRILVGKPKKRGHLEDLGMECRKILKWILKIRWVIIVWSFVDQGRDEWQAVMKIVMNIWVSSNLGYFLASC